MVRTRSKSLRIVLLRGVLGGIAGGFVFAGGEVDLLNLTGWDNRLGYFLFLFLIYGLPFGVFMGFVLSIGIWLIHAQTGKAFGIPARATLGTVFGMIACAITLYAVSSDREGYVQSPWKSELFGFFLLGLAFGGIPALIVGNPRDDSRAST